MNLRQIIDRLYSNGDIDAVRNDTRVQFGTPARRYLGATFLPERLQENLSYTETEVRYRTIIANDGIRYSPAQLKDSGAIVGSMNVTLGHSDIARQFSSADYDKLIRWIGRGRSMEASLQLIRWLDQSVNLALVELNEKQRWDAIVNALVYRRGDNGYVEPVYYPNPAGHRTTLLTQWSDPLVDPYPDIIAGAKILQDKGMEVNRIITSRSVISILAANPKMALRAGVQPLVLNSSGNLVQIPTSQIDREALNRVMGRDGLPAPETYDLSYNTQVGSARFMPADVWIYLCTTGRDEEIETENETLLVQNTLGYTGVGPAAGQASPGRVLYMQAFDNKAPRVEGEGWQATLPVILDPEAVVVLKGIT
jgi:hypothetical protein